MKPINVAHILKHVFGWIFSRSLNTPDPNPPTGPTPDPIVVPPDPPPAPAFTPLPRLRVRGHCFEQADGTRWTAIECSDFNLLNRWQHGEDIRPLLAQRRDIGFNLLRVWTLYDLAPGIGVFLDLDYARVGDFLDLCASYGFYVEFTAYTSTERPDHWWRLVGAVGDKTNALLELVNEGTLPVNRIEMPRYGHPAGYLASRGSSGFDDTITPYWDYVTVHSNGQPEEQRKIGHNAMEIWRGPTLTNETSRYPDVGMWAGASLARQQQLARDSAAAAALLCAGSCFHSAAGKTSVLFDADTEAVARAWVAGAKSIDLAYQDGNYYHLGNLETEDILRAYSRRTTFGECIVLIRK